MPVRSHSPSPSPEKRPVVVSDVYVADVLGFSDSNESVGHNENSALLKESRTKATSQTSLLTLFDSKDENTLL